MFRRAVAILLVGLILVVGSHLSTATAAPQSGGELESSPQAAPDVPDVTITAITPEILQDEDEVTLRVKVHGGQAEDLRGARLGVFMHADPFTSVAEILSFLNWGRNDSWSADERLLTDEEVARATTEGVEVAIPMSVDALPLWNPSAWGPYGVTVRLLPGRGSHLDGVPQDRTLLLWYGPDNLKTSQVNVTVTDVSGTLHMPSWQSLAQPGVALALSPTDLTSALNRDLLHDAEVVMVPVAGASLSLLAMTEHHDLYDLASHSRSLRGLDADVGQTQLRANRINVLENLVIADSGWMGRQVVQDADGDSVLSAPEGIAALDSPNGTASSRFLVDPRTGMTVIPGAEDTSIPEGATTVVSSWRAASQGLSTANREERSELNARQWLRAVSAVSTRMAPEEPIFWVNVPAKTLGDDPQARLSELLDVPWVTPVSLQRILDSPPSTIDRDTLGDELSLEQARVEEALDPLSGKLQEAQAVLEASDSTDSALTDATSTILAPTNAQITEAQRQSRVSMAVDVLDEFTDVVEVVPTGTVNVVGRNAPFPVTLKNNGPYPLNISVELQASDPRLSTRDVAEVLVPSGGSVSTSVPVAAVGTGSVNVTVLAKTPSGATLDTSPPISVRVRADWEGPGIWVLGSVLAISFVAGIVRTIRKGKRRMSTPETHTTTTVAEDAGVASASGSAEG